jgi:hypothetical protein
MISLSDDELRIVMDAARPIPARERDLRDVVAELAKYQEIVGEGPSNGHSVPHKRLADVAWAATAQVDPLQWAL